MSDKSASNSEAKGFASASSAGRQSPTNASAAGGAEAVREGVCQYGRAEADHCQCDSDLVDMIAVANTARATAVRERDEACEALAGLVRLKDRKETAGKDQTYCREQPLAWERARSVLARIRNAKETT